MQLAWIASCQAQLPCDPHNCCYTSLNQYPVTHRPPLASAGEGVCVQASTLGSLEALLEFLKSPAVKIPVSGINIGPVHKRDVMRASVMLEKGRKKFACLLAFDVPVTREARELSESLGVRVFTADIIYHLFDQFTAYLKTVSPQHSLSTCCVTWQYCTSLCL